MGAKSDKRAARTAAAQSRDAGIVAQAARDPFLVDWMEQSRKLDPKGFEKAVELAKRTARNPSSPDYVQALVAVGGLQALQD